MSLLKNHLALSPAACVAIKLLLPFGLVFASRSGTQAQLTCASIYSADRNLAGDSFP